VVGFALETEDLLKNATAKLKSKGCDWIVANAVDGEDRVFGNDQNTVALVTAAGMEVWPRLSKQEVGRRIAAAAADYLGAEISVGAQAGAA
jgi:phosphopantothenoylcysteine decarboxylase/phosphopantothenate--cysteine ligase